MSSYAKKQFISTLIIISAFMIAPILALATSGVINDPAQPDSAMPTIGENTPPSIAEGDMAKLIRYIYLFGLAAAGLAAMGALIYGGVLYLTAGGSQGQVTKGKKRIYGALYGVGLILVSYIILYTINPALVSFTNPATDPLKQYYSDFWNISEYGKAHANAPKDAPCYDSKDCTYDLACCSSGQAACEQQFSYLDNNLMLSILGIYAADAATQQWFKCGFEDYQWVEQSSCPNGYQSAEECAIGSTTNCCSPDNKPIKPAICCGAPRLVAALSSSDCNQIYGSDQAYTTGEGADKKTFLGHGWCPNGCGEPLKTCQPIQSSGSIADYAGRRHETTDRLQETCFRSEDYFSSAKDSCLDERLICNQFFGQCRAPGKTGDPCKDKYDCCQGEAGFWKKLWGGTMPDVKAYNTNPNCQVYKAAGISLDCKEGICTPLGQSQEEDTTVYGCTTINKIGPNRKQNQCGQTNGGNFANDATGYPILDTTFKMGSGCQLADRNLSLCCCKQMSAPPASGTLEHDIAVSQLQQEGINVKTGARAADLSGIHQEVINELIDLKADCACDVTVTEGTGGDTHASGTCSHANGWKTDIKLSDGINTFLASQTSKGTRSDDAPMYQHNNAIYAKEPDHWDMQFLCQNL